MERFNNAYVLNETYYRLFLKKNEDKLEMEENIEALTIGELFDIIFLWI